MGNIDNRDPSSPSKIGFVNIPANKDIAVKGDRLYADSHSDLLVFDISNMQNAELISHKENIFEFSASKLPGCPYQSTDPEKRIDHHRGGWMLNPGIGLQFNPEHGPCWHLSIGYNIDHSQFDTHEGTSRTIETDITYKRLMAGVGFAFSL